MLQNGLMSVLNIYGFTVSYLFGALGTHRPEKEKKTLSCIILNSCCTFEWFSKKPKPLNLPFAELTGVRPGEEGEPLGPT